MLHEEVRLEAAEGRDHRFCRLAGFGQNDAAPLGRFQQFDDQRGGPDQPDQVARILGRIGEGGRGHTDAMARKHLMRMEFIARRRNPGRPVDAIGADGFELSDDRRTVGRDRGADARDHGVVTGQALAVVMHFGRQRIDRHVAAGGVDDLHPVAAFLAFFDKAAGGIIVLAAEHGDAQGPVRRGLADTRRVVDVIAEFRLAEPFPGHDGDTIAKRLTAQQHMAGHAAPVGQRDLDRPGLPVDFQRAFNDIAHFGVAVGRGHLAPVDDLGRTGDHQVVASGHRMHGETHMRFGRAAEGFDIEGMQGRGLGPGIHLDLEGGQAEFGQGNPFLPAETNERRRVGMFGIGHDGFVRDPGDGGKGKPVRRRDVQPLPGLYNGIVTGERAGGGLPFRTRIGQKSRNHRSAP